MYVLVEGLAFESFLLLSLLFLLIDCFVLFLSGSLIDDNNVLWVLYVQCTAHLPDSISTLRMYICMYILYFGVSPGVLVLVSIRSIIGLKASYGIGLDWIGLGVPV